MQGMPKKRSPLVPRHRYAIPALLVASAVTAQEGWQTNLDEAIAQSKKEGKPVLVEFTGSDW